MRTRVVAASAGLLAALVAAAHCDAVQVNLAEITCKSYEDEILTSTLPGYSADSIDTVMWLLGFSVARAGERAMFGDALEAFGFALDAQCKTHPDETLLDAVTHVPSRRTNPMDLTGLDCATFETRHSGLRRSDPQSARTVTMWLFGYAVGLSGSRTLDPGAVGEFDGGLAAACAKHPQATLFDALIASNPAVPALGAGRKAGNH